MKEERILINYTADVLEILVCLLNYLGDNSFIPRYKDIELKDVAHSRTLPILYYHDRLWTSSAL